MKLFFPVKCRHDERGGMHRATSSKKSQENGKVTASDLAVPRVSVL